MTIISVCFLTYHRVTAICSLTTFRKTTECKNLSAAWSRWLLDISDIQHVLSFALELILLSDYWFQYIYDEFDLVVFTTVGLIITHQKRGVILALF